MKRFFVPTILILLAMAVYVLYTEPLYLELKRQIAKEEAVKAAIVEAEQAQMKLREVKQRYESFPPDADDKLAQLLPERIDPIKLLIDASEFLERNGYSAKSVNIAYDDSEASSVPYRKHKISFSISASYDMFREFLNALEASLVMRDAATVSFTVADSRGTPSRSPQAIHTYNIEVVGYSLR